MSPNRLPHQLMKQLFDERRLGFVATGQILRKFADVGETNEFAFAIDGPLLSLDAKMKPGQEDRLPEVKSAIEQALRQLLGNVNVSQGRDTLNQALGGKTAVVKPQH